MRRRYGSSVQPIRDQNATVQQPMRRQYEATLQPIGSQNAPFQQLMKSPYWSFSFQISRHQNAPFQQPIRRLYGSSAQPIGSQNALFQQPMRRQNEESFQPIRDQISNSQWKVSTGHFLFNQLEIRKLLSNSQWGDRTMNLFNQSEIKFPTANEKSVRVIFFQPIGDQSVPFQQSMRRQNEATLQPIGSQNVILKTTNEGTERVVFSTNQRSNFQQLVKSQYLSFSFQPISDQSAIFKQPMRWRDGSSLQPIRH